MKPKFVLGSRTFVLNFVTLAIDLLALPAFGALVPMEWLPTITAIAAVLNIALRVLGGAPLTFLPPVK